MQAQDTPLRLLTQKSDVTLHIRALVANCVEDWFPNEPLNTEDFIDRLCTHYLNDEGWDIESMDTPAVREIMREARHTKRELA